MSNKKIKTRKKVSDIQPRKFMHNVHKRTSYNKLRTISIMAWAKHRTCLVNVIYAGEKSGHGSGSVHTTMSSSPVIEFVQAVVSSLLDHPGVELLV